MNSIEITIFSGSSFVNRLAFLATVTILAQNFPERVGFDAAVVGLLQTLLPVAAGV
ncbi:MAG: hypothetical protein JXO49_06970 [Deltaproteobacteria bacterium]|nr:hypothetical protein [Candidatus Anaeroferrophillus wilburensis]MBN2889069.1 hypothetical protein [Deltaproteobacteria bacterium]